MLEILINNPFRILGCYSNSPKRDIVANKGKIVAFLKVNRSVDFPLDLNELLPKVIRNLEVIDKADAHLAIAKEQIKYAQFWFINKTQFDVIAFNHLISGNIDRAIDIWSKQESLSSLQNKLVCFLIKGKYEEALIVAERLYEKYGDIYIENIDPNCTLQMTGAELLHQLIDNIGEEEVFLDYDLSQETKEYIKSLIVAPLIKEISSLVDKSKKVDHKDSDRRKEAGLSLRLSTKEKIRQLKRILPGNDPQYVMIADKLGLEILQCGIDYYNNSDDDDAPHTAMSLQKYAQSIVAGNLAKQRCNENVKILQDVIDKLPPSDVIKEHNNLQHIITLFLLLPSDVDSILIFLKDTRDDLVSIKEKLGKDHPFYKKEATTIAQVALGKSIETINEIQKSEFPKLNGSERDKAIKTISHAFATSWKTMLWIELIDFDEEFKINRFIPNKTALKNILDQVKAFNEPDTLARILGGSYSVFEGCAKKVFVDRYIYYTETEMFMLCTSISGCQEYLQKYPEGRNANKVKNLLFSFKDDKAFNSAKSIDDYKQYIANNPRGKHVEEAKAKIDKLEKEKEDRLFNSAKSIEDYNYYLSHYPNGRHKEEAKAKIQILRDGLIRSLIYKIELCKSVSECTKLLENCKYYSNYNRNLLSILDDKFFSLCSDIDDYELYISKMSLNAKHRTEAEKTIKEKKIKQACLIFIILSIIVALGGWGVYSSNKEQKNRIEERNRLITEKYEQLKLISNPDSCIAFLSNYPDCADSIKENVKLLIPVLLLESADSLITNYEGDTGLLQDFIEKYKYVDGVKTNEAIDKVAKELEEENERQREIERQEEEKEEYEKYGTDAKAWNTATSINTINAYREYLERYPNGRYKETANKKIIDLEVQKVINSGDYGYLPPSQKVSSRNGSSNTITIRSRCDRTITVMYSGVKSVKIEIGANRSRTFTLPSGNYRVVATASGVLPFYGTENLTGGSYESEYYIETRRY